MLDSRFPSSGGALLQVGREFSHRRGASSCGVMLLQDCGRACLHFLVLLLLCRAVIPLQEHWWLGRCIAWVRVLRLLGSGLGGGGLLSGNPLLDGLPCAVDGMVPVCREKGLLLPFCLRLELCQVPYFVFIRLRLLLLSLHDSLLPAFRLILAL